MTDLKCKKFITIGLTVLVGSIMLNMVSPNVAMAADNDNTPNMNQVNQKNSFDKASDSLGSFFSTLKDKSTSVGKSVVNGTGEVMSSAGRKIQDVSAPKQEATNTSPDFSPKKPNQGTISSIRDGISKGTSTLVDKANSVNSSISDSMKDVNIKSDPNNPSMKPGFKPF